MRCFLLLIAFGVLTAVSQPEPAPAVAPAFPADGLSWLVLNVSLLFPGAPVRNKAALEQELDIQSQEFVANLANTYPELRATTTNSTRAILARDEGSQEFNISSAFHLPTDVAESVYERIIPFTLDSGVPVGDTTRAITAKNITNTTEPPVYATDGSSIPDWTADDSSSNHLAIILPTVLGGLSLIALIVAAVLLRRRRRKLASISSRKQMLRSLTASRVLDSRDSGWDLFSAQGAAENGGGNIAVLWTIKPEELQLQTKLGEGSYGVVYKARWNEAVVCVKVLASTAMERRASLQSLGISTPLDTADEHQGEVPAGLESAVSTQACLVQALHQEAGMLASLRHPHVVQYLGMVDRPACLVMEHLSRGSLLDVIVKEGEKLTWTKRLSLAFDAAKGMLYLHTRSPPILHRDLKSPNLLVGKHYEGKIADFNLSQIMSDTADQAENGRAAAAGDQEDALLQNPRWLSPEMLRGRPPSMASDVYSFGVVMWELLTLEVPWRHNKPRTIIAAVLEGQRPLIPPPASCLGCPCFVPYTTLMQRCWAPAPEARPGFDTVAAELRAMCKAAKPAEQHHHTGLRQGLKRVLTRALPTRGRWSGAGSVSGKSGGQTSPAFAASPRISGESAASGPP